MRTILTGFTFCLFTALAAVACEPSDSGAYDFLPAPPPAGSGSPGTPGTPTPPAVTCAPVTGPGTTHSGDVTGEAVWTAAMSPHIVTGNVSIRGGAKLTIEPCAEVRVAKGAHVTVAFPGTPNTGTLIAEGTAQQPIRFTGHAGARWASIGVHAPGTARLAYVTLEDGGGGDFQRGATLVAEGDGVDGSDPIVRVDHVTIRRSLGAGAWLARGASFAGGSDALVVESSGSDTDPYPLDIEEHAIDTLPAGKYTGNRVDEIMLAPAGGSTGGSGLLADATLHDRGVPYHVGRSKGHSLVIGGRPDGELVTLTIEPGVVMRFTQGSAFKVQHVTNQNPSTAALKAVGTAAKPIVFSSAAAVPRAGDWVGLWFGGVPDPSDRLDHVRIEHAGGDCGCILSTCSAITQHEGAVIFTAQPPSAFITNSVFANVAGHGITEGYVGTFIDYRPTNTFDAVAGCAQTRPSVSSTSCPLPQPACD